MNKNNVLINPTQLSNMKKNMMMMILRIILMSKVKMIWKKNKQKVNLKDYLAKRKNNKVLILLKSNKSKEIKSKIIKNREMNLIL